MAEKIAGFVSLARIPEWNKSAFAMLLAAAFALPLYGVPEFFPFLAGIASVSVLWGGLYALNDFTDRKDDAGHEVKKHRPVPAGIVSPKQAIAFSLLLVFISLALGLLTGNIVFLFLLLLMATNQLLYCVKPFRLKKKAPFDLVSGSLVNPLLRFYAGWALAAGATAPPVLALLFVLGFQFGGFGLYRLSSSGHEKRLGYRSSAAVSGEKKKPLFYAALALACMAFIFSVLNGVFFPELDFLGALGPEYALIPIVSLFFFPFYRNAIRKPEKAYGKGLYGLMYLHYSIVVLLTLLLIFWRAIFF